MNADFASKSGSQGRRVDFYLNYLSRKRAGEIQKLILDAHAQGKITGALAEFVEKHANVVEWTPASERRSFEMLYNTSRPESGVAVSLINAINRDQFWRLRRCKQCARFFFPRQQKRRYCGDVCLREHDSTQAQKRVEQARANRRWNEVKGKLLLLQTLGRRLPFSEIVARLPGFDAKLLAEIVEEKRDRRELAKEIKYANRKILLAATLK